MSTLWSYQSTEHPGTLPVTSSTWHAALPPDQFALFTEKDQDTVVLLAETVLYHELKVVTKLLVSADHTEFGHSAKMQRLINRLAADVGYRTA